MVDFSPDFSIAKGLPLVDCERVQDFTIPWNHHVLSRKEVQEGSSASMVLLLL